MWSPPLLCRKCSVYWMQLNRQTSSSHLSNIHSYITIFIFTFYIRTLKFPPHWLLGWWFSDSVNTMLTSEDILCSLLLGRSGFCFFPHRETLFTMQRLHFISNFHWCRTTRSEKKAPNKNIFTWKWEKNGGENVNCLNVTISKPF